MYVLGVVASQLHIESTRNNYYNFWTCVVLQYARTWNMSHHGDRQTSTCPSGPAQPVTSDDVHVVVAASHLCWVVSSRASSSGVPTRRARTAARVSSRATSSGARVRPAGPVRCVTSCRCLARWRLTSDVRIYCYCYLLRRAVVTSAYCTRCRTYAQGNTGTCTYNKIDVTCGAGVPVTALCNNGECSDHRNSHRCTCRPGFNGSYCDVNVNECASAPCRNGATCHDLTAMYHCDCAPGYQVCVTSCALYKN